MTGFENVVNRFSKRCDGSAHGLHTGHEDRKSKHDVPDIPVDGSFARHSKNNTDNCYNRSDCGR